MTTFLLLKLAHLVAFVYWLGGDLGTYLSSRCVVDPKLTPAQRATALKIMLGCDQGPKLAMPLIFALGYSMSTQMQFIVAPAYVEALVWLVCLAWFANVNYLYFTDDAEAKQRLSQVDFWFRIAVVTVLVAWGLAGLLSEELIRGDWLAVKILVFAGLVSCGIYIRLQLKPFGAAFGQLMKDGSSAKLERVLSNSIARCRPAVYLIWAGLVFNAALGMHLVQV